MGYWSNGIMGGDQPEEIKLDLIDTFLFKQTDDESLIKWIGTNGDDDVQREATLVLGLTIITTESTLSDTIKSLVLKACDEDIADDSCSGHEERVQIIEQFRKAIEKYDGTTPDLDHSVYG